MTVTLYTPHAQNYCLPACDELYLSLQLEQSSMRTIEVSEVQFLISISSVIWDLSREEN